MFRLRPIHPIGAKFVRTYARSTARPRGVTKWFALGAFGVGLGLSYQYSAQEIVDRLTTSPLPKTPLETERYTAKLESQLQRLPVVRKYSNDPDYQVSRSWNQLDTVKNGIHSTLNTPGSVAITPITFYNKKNGESISVIHLGKKLCGYPFLVHGGIISLIIDETLKRHCMLQNGLTKPENIHTENLTLNYKFPTVVDNFVMIKSKTAHTDDGSIEARAIMQRAKCGRTLVKANAKFRPERKWFWIW
ncbi:hypothetical protein OGAPHI_006037 [Ogataea philodendri]|uniref:Thioesterase domain-containing protein n=1 Tax=Ogataea philodendri TaxID=1378263 RepID=A0A9P8NXS5_9ASCO|nr:uncharacterized protein OGAPHI_006037 [Ogataea philodendri]KAH3661858.1 hypothetical protein OGAPHI_006037 [Ogataea philodendri]